MIKTKAHKTNPIAYAGLGYIAASAATTIIIYIVDETKRQASKPKTKAKFTVALSSFEIHRRKSFAQANREIVLKQQQQKNHSAKRQEQVKGTAKHLMALKTVKYCIQRDFVPIKHKNVLDGRKGRKRRQKLKMLHTQKGRKQTSKKERNETKREEKKKK